MSQDDDATIERVAKRICLADNGGDHLEHHVGIAMAWGLSSDRYLKLARAALSAMPQRELLAEALDALTPFAVGARSIDVDPPGDHEPSHGRGSVTAGDLRRARAAADKIRAALDKGEPKP